MKIILLGPPGAGKGTQAKILAQKIKLAHISTGDILRQNVSKGTELGKEAKVFMDKGALVPDGLVTRMLEQRLGSEGVAKGFILDGYPRNISQAKALDSFLSAKNTDIDLVVYLDASEPVIIQRLSGRRVCKKCGENFHIKNMPPKKESICDNCGASLYQRSDDNVETIKNRLQVYGKEVSVLIEYYKAKNKLYAVSADLDSMLVLDKVIARLGEINDSVKV